MKTALFDKHKALGAKMTNFGGWEMPLQYKSPIEEHMCVRENVGLFDVSHMGRLIVTGPEAERFLDILSTNHIVSRPELSATYTVWCKLNGGAVDDGLMFKYNLEQYFIVVNAANRMTDLVQFQMVAEAFNVKITSRYDEDGILALQGPKAWDVLRKVFPNLPSIKHMHFAEVDYNGEKVVISRTGYTGEDGCEIYATNLSIVKLWDTLLEVGKSEGIQPIGLAARDSLRLEMGYALYGHELTRTLTPVESVAAWTVKFDKPQFLGKKEMLKVLENPKRHRAYGVMMDEKAIPRESCKVQLEGHDIGIVTSGGFSPSLNASIALILVGQELNEGQSVNIVIRDQSRKAQRVALPFYQPKEVHHVFHGKS